MMIPKPKGLKGHAGALWDAQAQRCWQAGFLSLSTLEMFVCMCELYGTMKELDRKDWRGAGQYAKYYQLYQGSAALFGMLPTKETKNESKSGERDEFGIPK